MEHPAITSWETGDARMRFLSLDGVHVAKANLLKSDGASRDLIRTQVGPIATDISTPTRTATLLGFDVSETDWPQVWPIVRDIVRAADTFVYDPAMTEAEARALWIEAPPGLTVVALEDERMLGSAKMGPNRPGPGSHVATASDSTRASWRSRSSRAIAAPPTRIRSRKSSK